MARQVKDPPSYSPYLDELYGQGRFSHSTSAYDNDFVSLLAGTSPATTTAAIIPGHDHKHWLLLYGTGNKRGKDPLEEFKSLANLFFVGKYGHTPARKLNPPITHTHEFIWHCLPDLLITKYSLQGHCGWTLDKTTRIGWEENPWWAVTSQYLYRPEHIDVYN